MRTDFKRGAALTLAAATVLLASGCVSLDANMTLDREAKASGELELTINKQLASLDGLDSKEQIEESLTEPGSEGDIPDGATVDVSETDSNFVVKVQMDDVVLDEDDLLAKVDPVANTVTFKLVNEGTDAADVGELPDTSKVDLTVNFPGDVQSYSGVGAQKVDDDTVRWEFPFNVASTATATSDIKPPSSVSAGLVIGLAALALGGLVGGGLALRRKTRNRSTESNENAAILDGKSSQDTLDEAGDASHTVEPA